jgi:hypothetical protein
MNLHRAPRPPGARYALQPAKVFSRGRSNRTRIERKTIYRSAAQGMRMAACQATRIIAGQSLGFVRFLPFQASPGRSNSTTICTHYLPNHTHTGTASTKPAMTAIRTAAQSTVPWTFFKINFTVEDASEMKRAKTGPVAQARFHTSPPGRTLCEKKRVSFGAYPFRRHLDSGIALRSVITALQITIKQKCGDVVTW